MTQQFKYKDAAGVIQTADFDTAYGLRPELSSDDTEWKLVATDPTEEVVTDHEGARPKR